MNGITHLNNNSNVYLVNGINVSEQQYHKSQVALNSLLRVPIQTSYNPTNGIWRDLYNAVNGLFSDSRGHELEYQISSQLELAIRQDLKDNRQIKIFAHSQGSVILRNILAKLDHENYSFRDIKVFTFGAANYFWPKDLQVFSFTNKSDYLARALNNLTEIYNNYILTPWDNLRNATGLGTKNSKLEFLDTIILNNQIKNPIKAHELTNYLGNFKSVK